MFCCDIITGSLSFQTYDFSDLSVISPTSLFLPFCHNSRPFPSHLFSTSSLVSLSLSQQLPHGTVQPKTNLLKTTDPLAVAASGSFSAWMQIFGCSIGFGKGDFGRRNLKGDLENKRTRRRKLPTARAKQSSNLQDLGLESQSLKIAARPPKRIRQSQA